MKPKEYINKSSSFFIDLAAILLVGIIGIIDHLTGIEIVVTVLYLFPVLLVTWYGGLFRGIVISIISILVWFTADITSGHQYSSMLISIFDAAGIWGTMFILVVILSKLRSTMERERVFSRTDFLTGAFNLRAFSEILEIEISRTVRYQRNLSLAYLDIDDFKQINDLHGHSVANKLLGLIIDTIRSNLRITDIIGRVGGDEFAILLPEANLEQALTVMTKVQNNLAAQLKQQNWNITFSIGLVNCTGQSCTSDDLLKEADKLMYEVKHSGKNRIKSEVYVKSK